ncbi:hypothetical protein [Solibacillus sp. FSL K6-1523]|uniref:hypothetical protein n=1 Tax=Solibacillus sp. FSL K6-1523 TaxID=2921471 RepID=UPI0030F7E0E9
MSFMQFFKRYLLPFAILTSALYIILTNPFANIAKNSETTTYSNKELIEFHEKYASLMHSILTNIQIQGDPLTIDFAMLKDEKVEILIKNYGNKKLKPREFEKLEKSIIQLITQQHFNPATFQIEQFNSAQSTTKTANRLSYYDLMESIRSPLLDKGLKEFHFDYEISSEFTKIMIKIANPISEKLKKEVQQISNDVLENNNFDSHMVKVVIIDE